MIVNTGLHEAVKHGNIKEAMLAIAHNPSDVNISDSRGKTPIISAIQKGNRLMAQLLIDNGANLGCIGADGWNVLHYAVHTQQYEIMRFIVDHLLYTQPEATLVVKNNLGLTPLHFAQHPFNIEKIALLLTFYGKKQNLTEDGWFSACSVDVQQAIERRMLEILITRYSRIKLLDHLLNASFSESIASNNAMIRAMLFILPNIEAKGEMARVIEMAREDSPDQWLESIQYNTAFSARPVFKLYSYEVFLDLLARLKRYMQYSETDKVVFAQQIKDSAQQEVNEIVTYYKKPNHTVLLHNRPFNLVSKL